MGLRSGKASIYLIDSYYNKVSTILFVLGDWPTFHHDAPRTGVSTYEKSLTASTVSSLGAKWTEVGDGPVDSSPVVADGLVFFLAPIRSPSAPTRHGFGGSPRSGFPSPDGR